ncbi:MAG: hypothetical protein ACP5IL_10555 [Syntrophobacteraceae bacterium]
MKVRSKFFVACLAIALVVTFGVATNAQAQCYSFGQIIGAPIYAAGVVLTGAAEVVGGAASLVAGAVTAPFRCGACTACAPCAAPRAAVCPGYCG